MKIVAVIPALDEAGNIGPVVRSLLAKGLDEVIVADNDSADDTAAEAEVAGAVVVTATRRGYGSACAVGSSAAIDRGADVVVYIDGDGSSRPDEVNRILDPIRHHQADLVLGSRVLGTIKRGAMGPHQRFGNWFSALVISRLYRQRFTDLGPYRAIRVELLDTLDMEEMTFGWPTEMTVKSAAGGASIVEVPVTWEPRQAGSSKISGTLVGTILAAWHILTIAVRYRSRRNLTTSAVTAKPGQD